MILALTFVHVLLSLAGIAAGAVVIAGMLSRPSKDRLTSLFLWTTTATSITGFLFPFRQFLPSHALGIVSLIVLPLVMMARSMHRMEGGWRRVYVIGSVTAEYLNVFVLVAQIFSKTPFLRELAPTQSEPAFVATQGGVLAVFVGLGFLAVSRFDGRIGSRPAVSSVGAAGR